MIELKVIVQAVTYSLEGPHVMFAMEESPGSMPVICKVTSEMADWAKRRVGMKLKFSLKEEN